MERGSKYSRGLAILLITGALVSSRPTLASDEWSPFPSSTNDANITENRPYHTRPHNSGTSDIEGSIEKARTLGGLMGTAGILRIESAVLGQTGTIRSIISGEYFTTNNFPISNAQNVRTAGNLAMDWVFHEYGETYISYGVCANDNNDTFPRLTQTIGALAVGIKGATPIKRGVDAGVDLRIGFTPNAGSQNLRQYTLSFYPRLITTFDARAFGSRLPLRGHFNIGIQTDRIRDDAIGALNFAEEYAYGIQKYNRLSFGLGLEAFPLNWFTVFSEYGAAYPLAAHKLSGSDAVALTAWQATPSILSLGIKVNLLHNISFLAAVELGFASHLVSGIPATPPYNLIAGISFQLDPATPRMKEPVAAPATAPVVQSAAGRVAGRVFDAEIRTPLADTIITMDDTGMPPVASDAKDGKFITHGLPSKKILLSFFHDGYEPAAIDVMVEPGKISSVQAFLTKKLKNASIRINLFSDQQRTAGKASWEGPKAVDVDVPVQGASVELPPGHYRVNIEAANFIAQKREMDIPEKGELFLDVNLAKKQAGQSLTAIDGKHIRIKQKIRFSIGDASILSSSHAILDQVAETIISNDIKAVLVEGHTDSRGNPAVNLKLSKQRAEAVVDYLARKGVERRRLTTEGKGGARPMAPNLTESGRDLNRRVEFIIVE